MRVSLSAVLTAGILTGAAALSGSAVAGASGPPTSPPPLGATIVGVLSASCPSTFTTIQAAITAASPAATLYVCAGTYPESLTIDKPLTLLGAQYGIDGRTRSAASETTITGTGGIKYTAGATTGTISGFTLNGYSGGTGEIVASNVGSGWTFTDNIIDVSNGGIYVNTDGIVNPSPSSIADNAFVQATPSWANSGDFGQAVLVWANTANNLSISNNSFTNLSGPGAGINTTGDGSCGATPNTTDFANNLTISGNSFTDNGAPFIDPINGAGFIEENFLALFCTTGADITNNNVTITDANDPNAYTPIYIGGGDWNTAVTGNALTGNGASGASGINFNSDFYAPGTGAVISQNKISGFLDGIHVRGSAYGGGYADPSDFTISGNSVLRSLADGIRIDAGSGGTISDNTSATSATDDCYDATIGSETAGTANIWTDNWGATSAPTGLCSRLLPTITSAKSATAVTGVPFSFTVTTLGYPLPTLKKSRRLPAGLSFTDNGDGTATIAGTPSTHGTYTLAIKGSNSAGKVTQNFTLVVDQAPTFTTAAAKTARAGRFFTLTIKTAGYPKPSIAGSSLPAGTILTDQGNGTAKLSGAVATSGVYDITMTATNSVTSTTQDFVLTVS
jgi:hypothetical protein